MKLLNKLRRDHVNLTRLMDMLEQVLDAFRDGKDTEIDLKIELLDYIHGYAEQVHQPSEELIFNELLNKGQDLAALNERMCEEHGKLVYAACRFRDTLEGMLQGEVITREEVEIRGREFIALQRAHIKLEEDEIFPLFESSITESEWEQLWEQAPQTEDPVFARQDFNRFRYLIDYLQAEKY